MSNMIYYTECSTVDDCNFHYAICSEGFCSCKLSFFYDMGTCRKCPGLGKSCEMEQCCSDIAMECAPDGICRCLNGIENSLTCSPQTPIYITASQIALSAALIMGMAALTMVIYRLCTKPRYLSARQRALASRAGLNTDNEAMSYANYLRASLTSVQIRVLTRLRDRPPSYDSRQTPVVLPEAPPPYEGVTEGLPLPPAYTEIVISTAGYINSTFVNPDPGPDSRTTDSDNSSVSRNCDINQSTDDNRDKVTEDQVDEKTETVDEHRIPTST